MLLFIQYPTKNVLLFMTLYNSPSLEYHLLLVFPMVCILYSILDILNNVWIIYLSKLWIHR